MPIKVKHEGNVTSRIMAAAKGGRGKRASEDGKAWMQVAAGEAQAGNRQLQGAHASPIGAGGGHAQLISAPAGGAPGITHAPSGASGGGGGRSGSGGSAGGLSRAAGGGAADGDYKVTGTDIFRRPDDTSTWDEANRQWRRRWLPGEKEAEAQQRVGDVKNAQAQDMYDYKLSADQRAELAKINTDMEAARRSGRFTPDEMQELERQAYARRMGIKPLPVPKEETAQQQFDKRLVNFNGQQGYLNSKGDFVASEASSQSAAEVYGGTHTDDQGRRWGVDKTGKLYEVSAAKDDFGELMKLVPESYEGEIGKDALGNPVKGSIPYSMEERMSMLDALAKKKDEFMASRRQSSAPAAPVQTDPAVASLFNFGYGQQSPLAAAGAPVSEAFPAPAQAEPATPEQERMKQLQSKWGAFADKR